METNKSALGGHFHKHKFALRVTLGIGLPVYSDVSRPCSFCFSFMQGLAPLWHSFLPVYLIPKNHTQDHSHEDGSIIKLHIISVEMNSNSNTSTLKQSQSLVNHSPEPWKRSRPALVRFEWRNSDLTGNSQVSSEAQKTCYGGGNQAWLAPCI
ncbi:hypothetical protein BGZ63DRAFT_382059 [Mariannaea sp. PMI_226]|nr:hypothetical protein BGZ63DRAFT_382059 [Mariannaea sp. PMI_226]